MVFIAASLLGALRDARHSAGVGGFQGGGGVQASAGAWSDLPEALRAEADAALGTLLAGVRSCLIKKKTSWAKSSAACISPRRQSIGRALRLHGARLGRHGASAREGVEPEDSLVEAMGNLMVEGQRSNLLDLRVGALAYRGGTDMLRTVATYGGAGAASSSSRCW